MYEVTKSLLAHSGSYNLQRWKVEDGGCGSFRKLSEQEFDQCETSKLSNQTARRILTNFERNQIGSIYSSLKTEVVVCASTATLKFRDSKEGDDTWHPHSWGVPVLVLEKNTRPGANRLFIYLAELGTGMPLWKDTITIHSRYVMVNSMFHQLSVSWNRNIQAGLQFSDSGSAYDLWLHTSSLISCPQNNGLYRAESMISKMKRKLRKGPKLSENLPMISVCDGTLQHITHVGSHDRLLYSSMQSLVGVSSEM